MKPGSVLVDLAVEQGGNCRGVRPGEIVETRRGEDRRHPQPARPHRRRRLGALRPQPHRLRRPAGKDGALAPDFEDEILKAALVARGGAVVHPALKAA